MRLSAHTVLLLAYVCKLAGALPAPHATDEDARRALFSSASSDDSEPDGYGSTGYGSSTMSTSDYLHSGKDIYDDLQGKGTTGFAPLDVILTSSKYVVDRDPQAQARIREGTIQGLMDQNGITRAQATDAWNRAHNN